MDLWLVLMEFVILLGCAFILGALAQKFRQSPILGYILSGMVVGPFMAHTGMVNQMAELGVSLLLFSIGLEFSFKELRRMGRMAFGGGGCQVMGTLVLLGLALFPFMTLPRALALGAIAALSSTTIVLRVLVDKAAMDSIHGRASLSVLLFQDIAIVPLVLMIGLLSSSAGELSLLGHTAKLFGAVAGLVLVLYLILYQLVPRFFSGGKLFANRELTVLFAISVGLGATWASHYAGISPALGAFVAGMLLGESPFATQIRADIGSVRTIMVTLFFASVGMFIKPVWFFMNLHWILPLSLLIFLFKAALIYGVTRIFGLDRRHALATGITLAQIGEFSFVLATASRDGGLLNPWALDLIVSSTIVLMLLTPYMVTRALPLSDWFLSFFSRGSTRKGVDKQSDDKIKGPENRVLVVGMGPAGLCVVETLQEQGLIPVIVDVNPLSQKLAREKKVAIFLGDASREEVLVHAGLEGACLAVITVPDPDISMQIIRVIRQLRPSLPLVVRCRYNRHLNDLKEAGATVAIDEETTMGEVLSREISQCLADDSCTLLACRMVFGEIEPEIDKESGIPG